MRRHPVLSVTAWGEPHERHLPARTPAVTTTTPPPEVRPPRERGRVRRVLVIAGEAPR